MKTLLLVSVVGIVITYTIVIREALLRKVRRNRARKILVARRASTPVTAPFENVNPQDVLRVWRALEKGYDLPADRVRVDDRLEGLLEPWIADPDRLLLFIATTVPSGGFRQNGMVADTWADLVKWCIEEERACGHRVFDWE